MKSQAGSYILVKKFVISIDDCILKGIETLHIFRFLTIEGVKNEQVVQFEG